MKKNRIYKRVYLLVFFTAILLSNIYAQSTNNSSSTRPLESIYIHTDKSIYTPGENVWFKAYILDNVSFIPASYSRILYLNVLDGGKPIITAKFPIQGGFAFGQCQIPDTLKNKTLQIVSYTENLKNLPPSCWFHSNIVVDSSPIDLWKIKFKPDMPQLYKSIVSGEVYCSYNEDIPIENMKVECSIESEGQNLFSTTEKTDSLGKFHFEWSIPESDDIKSLVLCLKGNQLNEAKELKIGIPIFRDGLQVNFYPEGGALVEGLLNKVAFEILDNNRLPTKIEGLLVNQNGDELQKVKTIHDGMGLVEFTPQPDESYYLKIQNPAISDSLYKLPAAVKSGYVLSLEQTDKSIVNLRINMSSGQKGNKVKLVVADGFNKDVIFESVLNDEKIFSFLTSSYPAGIYTLTLMSENNIPLAERLIFLNKFKKLNLSIETDKEVYGPRERVNMTVKSTDFNGKPVPANISLSVAEENRLIKHNQNSLAFLLLSSQLKGTISNPDYYLQGTPAADSALNVLLMAHGWRKFDLVRTYTKLMLSPENEPGIHGYVYNKRKKPVPNASVQIINTYTWQGVSAETNEEGAFFIPIDDYIQIADNHDLSISATIPNKNKSKLNIAINKEIDTGAIAKLKLKEENIPIYGLNKNENLREKELINTTYSDFDNSTEYIDEVAITGKKLKRAETIDETRERIYKINKKESQDIKMATLSSPYGSEKFDGGILQLLRTIQPGFQLLPTADGKRILKYRGNNSLLPEFEQGILFVVDGIPKGDDVDAVSWIDLASIKEIKVITNPGSALIYSTGLSGVVEITLKDGSYTEKPRKEAPKKENLSIIQGFEITKDFYSPDYSLEGQNQDNNIDFRSTLYWNPNVQLDNQGQCKLEFYNSDKQNKFRCRVVGVSDSGLLGDSEINYWVQ